MPSAADSLFTLTSLTSLQGAALAALVVPNTLGALIPKITVTQRTWAGFVVAQGCAYLTAASASDAGTGRWLIALLNGFLIFASAFGLTAMGARTTTGSAPEIMQGPAPAPRRGFFVPWRVGPVR